MGVRLVYQRDDSKYTVFHDKENLDGEKGPPTWMARCRDG